MSTIEERLARAEATLEIFALEGEYARAWDTGDAAGWADVFTADGVFEMVAAGGVPGTVVRGTAALRDFCTTFTATTAGLHLMHLPQVKVAGDTAEGRLHFEFIGLTRAAPNHTARRHTTGYYIIRYRRTAAGWRIEHRLEKAVARAPSEFFDI